MTRAIIKGTRKLNPTTATLKEGSELYRKRVTSNVKGFKKVKPPMATKGKTK